MIYLFSVFSNSRNDGKFVLLLILIVLVVFFIFSLLRIISKKSVMYNLEHEKLEITQDGLIMTYVQRLQNGESLKRIELSWEHIINAESITRQQFSFRNFNWSDLFTFNEEYKTIQINTTEGKYKLCIEFSLDAITLINENAQGRNEDVWALSTWICPNCNEVNKSNSRFCSKCGLAKEPKPKKPSTQTIVPEASHKCTCGERFYGDTCPNCGRKHE